MNLDQLGQSFEANKVPVLAAAGAAVVGFALYQRKKAGGNTAAPAQGVQTTPGVYSAGGQVLGANGAAAYDSTSSDVYGLVQPQLESLGQQVTDLSSKLNAVPVSAAPTPTTPLAASLFAPTYNGNYVRYASGGISEVETDGSEFNFVPDQWSQAVAAGGKYTQLGAPTQPTYYSTEGNLAAKNTAKS